jgi:acetyltransferase-like isoleucine patch superfamily enzyme
LSAGEDLRVLSSVLWVAWRAGARLRRSLRRLMFSHVARLHPGAQVLEHGRIVNIAGDADGIEVGAHTVVAGELLTFAHAGRIRIGEWCFVGEGTRIWSAADVAIGDRVLISHGVNIHDSDAHPKDADARHRQFRAIATTGHPRQIDSIDAAPVRIGDDVWIGFNATILKGVSIGARSIVAACSVVTKDIPPDSIHIGSNTTRRIE